MNISPQWLREFVDIKVDDARLAEDLTHAGIAVEGFSQAGGATVFAMEITTNRVDAMNHYGVARECSAIYDLDLRPIAPKLPASGAASFPIEIEAPELCSRYRARAIHGVNIAPSPRQVLDRLLIEDHHGINNVADATNYVLMEMGHPTHAFDLDLLDGGKIVVRLARPGEKLKTLDGLERELHPEDLVIADAMKPVGLAGIMGGFDTMITERTRNVLIESAWFDPASVRRTARRHGMHTDASHRFERGADWGAAPLACDRVAELVLASAGGTLGASNDAVARDRGGRRLEFHLSELRRILGQEIPNAQGQRILRRLGFVEGREAVAGDVLFVTIPTWRMDVEREIDVVEEVARVYGFNNFKNRLPAFPGAVIELPNAKKHRRVRSRLLALGYSEIVSSTFISVADAERFSQRKPVPLENPLSDEEPLLRNSLLPGMLNTLAWNFNRGTTDLRLFEMGHVFGAKDDGVLEKRRACFAATGGTAMSSVEHKDRALDFFDLKGDAESLLQLFDESYSVAAPGPSYMHPARSALIAIGGIGIGYIGQLHPEIASARKFRQEVWIGMLALDELFENRLRQPRFAPLSRFPAVERDFSFILPDWVHWNRLRDAIAALGIPELRAIEPRELFRGGSVPGGSYSLLVRLTFQSAERTLRDDEVNAWSQQAIAAAEAVGAKLRS